ncbi:glucose-1-phosphate adenylyltransferase [Benzoatithermus flavus]|uniref:Glucose-1-phosphate adenylyltransferase n=1 Tax=Benzoatithermus flavus TaxID=3108223 RepID=A0ABU8Y0G2_9PROT
MASIIRNTFALVLAGGRGSRLKELTDRRAKPAVHFGGTARIIDFALSNAINSGIRRIGVATQYKAHSLIRHLQKGWTFLRSERNESFDILPASQRTGDGQWYQGTADAVYQNLDILERYPIEHIVVLAGDHVYKMDYAEMLMQHLDSRADVTVGCIEVPREEAVAFGVMRVDEQDRIENFIEKPNDPPGIPGRPEMALASMGIYVFDAAFLYDQLRRDAAEPYSQHDFGRDVIPYVVQHGRAVAHRFGRSAIRTSENAEAYWRDVGTLDAFFEANLDLTSVLPALDLYDRRWPIWTSTEMLPPAKFVHDEEDRRGMAISSLVANGCIVSGARVRRSLLSTGVRVNSFADVDGAVIMPYAEIGRGARLCNVIVDSDVRVPPGLVVGEDPALDARRFRRTDGGITLITQVMLDRMT